MNVTTWVSKKMRGDKTIRYVALFLVAVSLIAVYTSASALVTNEYGGNTSKMLMKHLATIAIGLVAMLVAHFINYKHYAKIAPLALIPIWILLVYTTYRGQDLNNASRTISIFKLSFQPSEWAKIILITYLAQEIYRMGDDIHNFKKVLVNLFLPSVITIAPILPENLSTALILFAAVIVTLFVGRVKFVHLLAIAGICVCLLGAYLLFDAARTNISNKKAQKELATSESSIAEESSTERTQPSTEPTSRVATWNKRLQTIFDEGEPFDKAHYQKTYNEQIAVLDQEISKGQGNIKTLNADLKKLRQEYAQMVAFAYKNRSHYDKLEFVFAANDFNQAFSRLRYIRQFTEARKTKMNQIDTTEQRINDEVEASQKAREEQAALLTDEKTQQSELQKEKSLLNGQISALKKKESQLQQDIKQKQQQAQKLQKAIDDLIAEEIRLANERAKKEAEAKGKKAESSKGMALTPAEKTLSTTFSANKGKLPWPVERGEVSSSYGKHTSVVSDKVTVTNSGIDIATDENAQARAVFDGTVTSVTKLTGSNTVVIVRHGEYFTVYSNIEEAAVKRGDTVKTKQNLGRIHTNKAEDKTELHFELLKETERQNPESWLSK